MPKLSDHIKESEDYKFCVKIPTRFSDVNAASHVSNLAIMHMFEDARARFYKSLGIEIIGRDYVLMIVSNQLNYYAECHWPIDFEVSCKVSKIGNSSFEISQMGRQNGELIATCQLTSVYTQGGKSQSIPQSFKSMLSRVRTHQTSSINGS